MSGHYTDSIDPLMLATRGRVIEGRMPLSELTRLRPLIRETEGDVEFSLHFSIDEGGTPSIRGVIKSVLVLECQRCMEGMRFPVAAKVALGIVSSPADAERLPEQYEPLQMTGEEVTVAGIVEDELILALPIVAMHKIEECPGGANTLAAQTAGGEGNTEDADARRKNPFAALAQLKETLTTDGNDRNEE